MSGEIEAEAVRPRPLSGGLWNIFSWLRREDSSSNDSLSSVGSTHTAASFAFLGPAHYSSATPIVLPPQGPPTDTYKKRLRDRNLRRQQDRDLTLHRKYGLYGAYDAFSLPSTRRNIADSNSGQDRERRATSECLQRRPAHVPGKRRAPQPPLRAATTGRASLATRNRKRPAPQPPAKISDRSKENIRNQEWNQLNSTNALVQMNSKSIRGNSLTSIADSVGCKSEKYSKKESNTNGKKIRSEKNFIKQIFENKKRNSGIETIPPIKILPNISELDKQAAEIIEACRLMEKNSSSEGNKVTMISKKSLTSEETTTCRFCNKCLKKYNSSVTCPNCATEKRNPCINLGDICSKNGSNGSQTTYTQTEQSVSASEASKIEEREKLKGMLKEMKYSLPKRPKNKNSTKSDEIRNSFLFKSNDNPNLSFETPTLKMGSSFNNTASVCQPSSSTFNVCVSPEEKNKEISRSGNFKEDSHSRKPIITQTKILTDSQYINKSEENNLKDKESTTLTSIIAVNNIKQERKPNKIPTKLEAKDTDFKGRDRSNDEIRLHTPLRISSLLNPVYIPKNNPVETQLNNTAVDIQSNNNTTVETQSSKITLFSSKDKQLKHETINTTPTEPVKVASSLITIKNTCPTNLDISQAVVEDKKLMKNDKANTEKQQVTDSLTVKSPMVPLATPGHHQPSQDKSITSSTSNDRKVNDSNGNHHSRRRNLIIQLEQSIAKGDEQSAAEAAVKLAQLRLSCSVLSFSSQIINNSSTPMSNKSGETKVSDKDYITKLNEPSCSKTDSSTQLVTAVIHKDNSARQTILKTVPEADEAHEGLETNQVIPQKAKDNHTVGIEVWVEDKEATRGPISLRIPRQAVLGELRRQVETSLGLAMQLQRWIIGRVLCINDNTPLVSVAGPDFKVPFYLCLVEAGSNEEITNRINEKALKRNSDVYSELMLLEQHALVSNAETFECEVCMEVCATGDGAVLRECVHSFCRGCLSDVIRHCEEPVVNCPALGCLGVMQEREIRALVSPEDYDRWLARGLAAAESGTRNAFHCRTSDCTGWALCEPGVQKFPCPVCKHTNCVLCQAIHEGETCEQYRNKIQDAVRNADMNETDEGTKALLESLISKGEALECPECRAIITKKWGCDWVKCSACKTEICWVTRGRRWGPGGRGDTSGGCRCGVDGKRCHPSCGYCH